MPFSHESLLWQKLRTFDIGGSLQVTGFTSESTATALVPKAGHHLRIYQIFVSTPTEATPGDIEWSDGG